MMLKTIMVLCVLMLTSCASFEAKHARLSAQVDKLKDIRTLKAHCPELPQLKSGLRRDVLTWALDATYINKLCSEAR